MRWICGMIYIINKNLVAQMGIINFLMMTSTKKTTRLMIVWWSLCDFEGIQTLNLLIRSQVLYSVELRSRPQYVS